jgi:hypothetical protein
MLNYDGSEEILFIYFKCVKHVIPDPFSRSFFKIKIKNILLLFSLNIYVSFNYCDELL